jgi:RNA polymerase sigma factor (sigma-70 family)
LRKENAPLNVDGTIKTKSQKQADYINKNTGELLSVEVISPHPDSDIFDSYLNNYQDDINRIIGKFRYSSHLLSHEDLVSEANLSLIKKRDDILSNFGGKLSQVDFKKIAYAFVRNVIRWTNYKIVRSPYVSKRTDFQHVTEDGFKSTYEVAVETNGEEEPFFEEHDRNEKCSYLMKMIKEYSNILTDQEIKILSCLEVGLNQYEMAEKLNVTRQAISCMSIKIFDKIRCHLGPKALHDDSFNRVTEGHQAISSFFRPENKNTPLEGSDRESLRLLLLSNVRSYTGRQISEIFMEGKYSHRQVSAFAVKNNLSFCLIKAQEHYEFSREEEDQILKLLKKGVSSQEISLKLKIPKGSVVGKKSHLTRSGRLKVS